MKVKISDLKKLARKAILNYGYNPQEAKVILEILFYAQLRGNNQNVVKLIGKGIPKDKRAGKIKTVKKTKLSALLDGNYNTGMIVMRKALTLALQKAKKYGFGVVGTQNTYSSTGAIGYYAREIAKAGYLGFAFSGSPPTVCHHGSNQALYGTNPMAIGFPTEKEPVVLDMATAAMAWYGLVQAKTAGQKIPNDVAYDAKGRTTTDPVKAMEGAIRPFDRSYKGANLAMMVEVFTGPLVGASFVGLGRKGDWGNLIWVIDPKLLGTRAQFKKQMSQLVQKVKKAKKLPGVKKIYLPGERGNKLTQKYRQSGYIDIEKNLYRELQKVARG